MIRIDVDTRALEFEVDEREIARRREGWRPPDSERGGYRQLYVQNVLQADEGCDFGFLVGRRGAGVPSVDI
jgi:dihydroxy-acid dehydratase